MKRLLTTSGPRLQRRGNSAPDASCPATRSPSAISTSTSNALQYLCDAGNVHGGKQPPWLDEPADPFASESAGAGWRPNAPEDAPASSTSTSSIASAADACWSDGSNPRAAPASPPRPSAWAHPQAQRECTHTIVVDGALSRPPARLAHLIAEVVGDALGGHKPISVRGPTCYSVPADTARACPAYFDGYVIVAAADGGLSVKVPRKHFSRRVATVLPTAESRVGVLEATSSGSERTVSTDEETASDERVSPRVGEQHLARPRAELLAGVRVVLVECGARHVLCSDHEHGVFSFGANTLLAVAAELAIAEVPGDTTGQLGHNRPGTCPPARVRGVRGRVLALACGANFSAVLTSDGLFMFGDNTHGELALERAGGPYPVLTNVGKFASVAAGGFHCVALTEKGDAVAWGRNLEGQLGLGFVSFCEAPSLVLCEHEVITMVRCGLTHSLAATREHILLTWGSNVCGELGIARTVPRSARPLAVVIGKRATDAITAMSCGPFSSAVVTAAGSVYSWGMVCGAYLSRQSSSAPQLHSVSKRFCFAVDVRVGNGYFIMSQDDHASRALRVFTRSGHLVAPFDAQEIHQQFVRFMNEPQVLSSIMWRATELLECELIATAEVSDFTFSHVFDSHRSFSREVRMRNRSTRVVCAEVQWCSTSESSKLINVVIEPSMFVLTSGASVKVTLVMTAMRNFEAASLLFTVRVRPVSQTHNTLATDLASSRCFMFGTLATSKGRMDMNFSRTHGSSALQNLPEMKLYLPRSLLAWACDLQRPLKAPASLEYDAALLMLDITGFSQMCKQLEALGDDGPEIISWHLNSYFGQLMETVVQHGGDVLKSVGDAIICSFAALGEEDGDDARTAMLQRAIACALVIEEKFSEYRDRELTLTLHVGVSYGHVSMLVVGGYQTHWEYVFVSRALGELALPVHLSQGAAVAVTQSVWDVVCGWCEGVKLEAPEGRQASAAASEEGGEHTTPPHGDGAAPAHSGGNAGGCVWRVVRMREGVAREALAAAAEADTATPTNEALYEKTLGSFLRAPVMARLRARAPTWKDEYRRVTSFFVKLQLAGGSTDGLLELFHSSLYAIQASVYEYGGMVCQLVQDEKGLILFAGFGLPPVSRLPHAQGAINAAISIEEELGERVAGIGVCTGKVFCGVMGCGGRKEYIVIGNTINMAARLMAVAVRRECRVVCDEATRVHCADAFEFNEDEPALVKGIAERVKTFVPFHSPAAMDVEKEKEAQRGKARLIGRHREIALIRKALWGLLESAPGRRRSSGDGSGSSKKSARLAKRPSVVATGRSDAGDAGDATPPRAYIARKSRSAGRGGLVQSFLEEVGGRAEKAAAADAKLRKTPRHSTEGRLMRRPFKPSVARSDSGTGVRMLAERQGKVVEIVGIPENAAEGDDTPSRGRGEPSGGTAGKTEHTSKREESSSQRADAKAKSKKYDKALKKQVAADRKVERRVRASSESAARSGMLAMRRGSEQVLSSKAKEGEKARGAKRLQKSGTAKKEPEKRDGGCKNKGQQNAEGTRAEVCKRSGSYTAIDLPSGSTGGKKEESNTDDGPEILLGVKRSASVPESLCSLLKRKPEPLPEDAAVPQERGSRISRFRRGLFGLELEHGGGERPEHRSSERSSADGSSEGGDEREEHGAEAGEAAEKRQVSPLILVTGAPGIGKTHLAQHTTSLAALLGLSTASIECNKGTSMHPFHGVGLLLLQGMNCERNAQEVSTEMWDKMLAGFDASEEGEARTLMRPILMQQHELSDLEARTPLCDEKRVKMLARVLGNVFAMSTVVVVDGVHDMDELSLATLLAFARSCQHMVCFFTAPTGKTPSALLAYPRLTTHELPPLSPEQSIELVRSQLRLEELPESLQSYVEDSNGNPGYLSEIVSAVRDQRSSGSAELRLDDVGGPSRSLEVFIGSRIDNLPITCQTFLKISSVIGLDVDLVTLQHIYPHPVSMGALRQAMAELDRAGLVRAQSHSFVFKSIRVLNAAHERLLASQRRAIHRSIAHYLDQLYARSSSRTDLLPTLAYHYHCVVHGATDPSPADLRCALKYNEMAGRYSEIMGDHQLAKFYKDREVDLLNTFDGTTAPGSARLKDIGDCDDEGIVPRTSRPRLRNGGDAGTSHDPERNELSMIRRRGSSMLREESSDRLEVLESLRIGHTVERPRAGRDTAGPQNDEGERGGIAASGFLRRKARWGKWVTRFFVLDGKHLIEYADESMQQEKMRAPVKDITWTNESSREGHAFTFALRRRHHRPLVLRARSFAESTTWRDVIQRYSKICEASINVQALTLPAIEANEKMRILSCNQQAEEFFGWSRDELVGKNVRALMTPYHAKRHDGYVRRYLSSSTRRLVGAPRRLECKLKDGSTCQRMVILSEFYAENKKRRFLGQFAELEEIDTMGKIEFSHVQGGFGEEDYCTDDEESYELELSDDEPEKQNGCAPS